MLLDGIISVLDGMTSAPNGITSAPDGMTSALDGMTSALESLQPFRPSSSLLRKLPGRIAHLLPLLIVGQHSIQHGLRILKQVHHGSEQWCPHNVEEAQLHRWNHPCQEKRQGHLDRFSAVQSSTLHVCMSK